jgi:2-keto-myo-inositol isomerase
MKADLVTDIRAASQARFDLIEIWAAKLHTYLEQHTTRDLRQLLDEHGLRAYSINSIENITFRPPGAQAALRLECVGLCQIAREIGCEHIVVVPGPRPADADEEAIIAESVRVLRELGNVAARFDVKLAFEFLGFPDCSVRTLALGREIIARVGRRNVGLVIDTFHFYVGGSTLESIAPLAPDQLFIFHINDAEDRPKSELRDHHRLLPGLGILPLKEIVSALAAIGYSRMASVEIFRPEYWDWDSMELALRAREAAQKTLGLDKGGR